MTTERKRGVVIAGLPHLVLGGYKIIEGKAVQGLSGLTCPPIDRSLIKTSLLYWDRIDIPKSDIVTASLPEEFMVLLEEGIVSRSPPPRERIYKHVASGVASLTVPAPPFLILPESDVFKEEQTKYPSIGTSREDIAFLLNNIANKDPTLVFNKLIKEKDTLWSYVQYGSMDLIPEDKKIKERTLLFEIHQALPTPSPSTPIDQILEFKNTRKSELLALRHEIDSIYHKISNASDLEHAKSMAFSQLELALLDLTKVSDENLGSKLRRSLKFEINPIGMASAASALAFGSIPLASLVAFGSCLKMDFSETILDTCLPKRLTPYKYIMDVSNDLSSQN